ncbi:MAG: asparagine synthetase [Thermofilum sp. ex4484_79]|nr:MAG: asparagine synthetase [Thermofilum sp. ex4484_79]
MLTQFTYIEEYLKNKELTDILKIQTTAIRAIEDFMVDREFLQLMPIITSKVTDPLGPDPGSSVIAVPKIKYYDQELVLTQSMILHKQLALITGAEKIFIFSPNIRLEDKIRKETGKHLFEFTQMDFEIARATMKDVMSLVEDLIIHVFRTVKTEREEELARLGRELEIPKKPFKVYTTHELEEVYGKDWEIPASKAERYPFWVICHKREFYDREDPERPGHYLNYDLIYPEGFGEALSGGEREWEYERIISRIRRDGLDERNYASYLEIAKKGLLIPSAGGGIGIERLVRYLTGKKHIGDIQVFRRVPGEEVIL